MTDRSTVWLDQALDTAFAQRVSDVHMEFNTHAHPEELRIRIRVAGELQEWPMMEGEVARQIVQRIRNASDIQSGQVRKPEEGRYEHRMGSGRLDPNLAQDDYDKERLTLPRQDLRLVVLPTVRGETLVLRLASVDRTPTIPELGFAPHNLEIVARILGRANGLFLFAGPVGSGKTTSMYSVLDFLGGPRKAVYSVEDPVERLLPDVTQNEVTDKAGMTFASFLRAIRRADPQVLMIGEIRDSETARAAIEISIAGARVVSSIHSNDSIAAIEAMLAMSGATTFQVMQSLRGVISQRLVKKIHAACAGNGCDICNGTGVDGRIPIHEVLMVTPELTDAVIQGRPRIEQVHIAKQGGMISLHDDAERVIAAGLTTPRWVTEVLGTE